MNFRSISVAVLGAVISISTAVRAEESAAVPTTPETVTPLPHDKTKDVLVPDSTPPVANTPATDTPAAEMAPASPSAVSSPASPVPSTDADLPAVAGPDATSVLAKSSAPAATISTAAPAFAPPRRRMGWFGMGVRFGTTALRLSPPDSLVARLNQSGTGQTWTASDLALNSDARTVTPSLHFGGSGYFFKIDFREKRHLGQVEECGESTEQVLSAV